ncbi:DUF6473 family protein [Ruegeria sp. EL01]|uniref:DUF6473 family protein n=1 Tax=Ruegeria sp. EL01 TaxID=2107578 RepID=UPI0020B149FF|nr:DUF6473 family protein [Ruegeria sp. EL01]
MSYHQAGPCGAEDAVCQYAGSKRWFRGPVSSLDKPFVACVGGDETFGRFVETPFPAVLGAQLGETCANFGSLFCGVEAMSRDQGLLDLINRSRLCVLQAPCVSYQSNRFYRVHSRRNDRFLEPMQDLVDLYPEEDFTEVHFVRHLLSKLHAKSDARFDLVAQELRAGWVQNLHSLLGRIVPPVVLLCLRVQRDHTQDPIPVDGAMTDQLRPQCASVVQRSVCVSGESDELEDMLFGTLQVPMAAHMIGPAAHRAIAGAVLSALRDLN